MIRFLTEYGEAAEDIKAENARMEKELNKGRRARGKHGRW